MGQSATKLLDRIISQLLSGDLSPSILELPNLDLKVNIIRVSCQNCIRLKCGGVSMEYPLGELSD
jgi:hypothetical protein